MDNKKLIQLAYDMGAHPYSVGGMVAALQKGIEIGKEEQKAIDNKRMDELLLYLEELEAHYRDLGQYDDGKPIRRVIEYIKSMEDTP